MGLLNIFKNRGKKNDTTPVIKEKNFDVKFSEFENGMLQVDFYNMKSQNSYDTTRLILNNKTLVMAGKQVQPCLVSWYNDSDARVLDETTGKFDSCDAIDYKAVLTQIDKDLLQKDESYCNVVMNGLLNKSRVEKYLKTGLQEKPFSPCGNYIGSVIKEDEIYKKCFSPDIGLASHNSDFMKNKRQELQIKNAQMFERQSIINNKKSQIDKLQSEIDDLVL